LRHPGGSAIAASAITFGVLLAFGATGGGDAATALTDSNGLRISVAGPAHVLENARYSYTVTVTNSRTDGVVASQVAVVGSYYTEPYEHWSGEKGAVCTSLGNGRMSCGIGDVPAGESRSFTVTLTAEPSPGTSSRTFVATSSLDPTMTATTAYVTRIVALPKGPTPPKIVPSVVVRRSGTTLTILVTVTNKGPGAMTQISVRDHYDYPAILIKSAKGCQAKPDFITCTIAGLKVGASTKRRFVADIRSRSLRTAPRILNVFSVAFPWHTNSSGFQEETYGLLTRITDVR
jgi:hypothetical protein